MGILANLLILSDQHGSPLPGRGHEDLVSRVAVKRLRQLTTLCEHRPRQFPNTQALTRNRLIQPLVEGAVKNELLLLDLLSDLPDGDSEIQRSCLATLVAILALARADRRRSSVTQQTRA